MYLLYVCLHLKRQWFLGCVLGASQECRTASPSLCLLQLLTHVFFMACEPSGTGAAIFTLYNGFLLTGNNLGQILSLQPSFNQLFILPFIHSSFHLSAHQTLSYSMCSQPRIQRVKRMTAAFRQWAQNFRTKGIGKQMHSPHRI